MALGDAILACLTERPMTGYELAKTFDASIGFFWKADHQQIYRELSRLRDRGHIRGREVVQSGKPNKLVYTLTSEGRAALKHWAARPSSPPSIKDDLLVRLYALDCIDIEPLRADLMARLEHHRDRFGRYERILKKRFPDGTCSRFTSAFVMSALWRSGAKRHWIACRPFPPGPTSSLSRTASAKTRDDLLRLAIQGRRRGSKSARRRCGTVCQTALGPPVFGVPVTLRVRGPIP